jgi:hypothetical protein
MSREESCYDEIVDAFIATHADVEPGKMMSSEALTVNGKVFCFYSTGKESMVFKLGKSADTERPRMAGWVWLNPFKNRGPMKAWYQVPFAGKKNWRLLADEALAVVREGRD